MKPNSAVLVVDMLYDFIYGALKCDRAKAIIPNIRKLIEDARQSSCPVIYACDMHEKGDHELQIWGEHAMKGTPGDVIIPELINLPNELVIEKHTYSSFLHTNLKEYLQDHNITTLYIVGIQAHICVQHAAYDAYTLGYKIFVPKNCTEAFDEEKLNNALTYMKEMYGVDISEI